MRYTRDHLRASAAITQREQMLLALAGAQHDSSVSVLPDKLSAIRAAERALAGAGVSAALIGGLAVAVRSGVPRATLDVDFAIPTGADRDAVAASFSEHGFRHTGSFPHSINFRHESGEPVQLAFDPRFDDLIQRAEPIAFGDLTIHVVTTSDLIAMKRWAAADPRRRRSMALRDQADVALLEGDVPELDEGW